MYGAIKEDESPTNRNSFDKSGFKNTQFGQHLKVSSQFRNRLIQKSENAGNLSYQKILLRLSKPEAIFDSEELFKDDVYSSLRFKVPSFSNDRSYEGLDKIRFDKKGEPLSRSMVGTR